MLDYDDFFDGSGRRNKVNLSTNAASSSSSLLSTVKKERLAREQRRRDERAALIIQKVWRGRRAALDIRQDIIGSLGEGSVAKRAGRLVGLYRIGVGADGSKMRAALGEWVESAGSGSGDGMISRYLRSGANVKRVNQHSWRYSRRIGDIQGRSSLVSCSHRSLRRSRRLLRKSLLGHRALFQAYI